MGIWGYIIEEKVFCTSFIDRFLGCGLGAYGVWHFEQSYTESAVFVNSQLD